MSITKWVREKAIAVQIDVDRDASISSDLRISAMPTTIVFRAGQNVEFVRQVGYQRPAELLVWLKAAESGQRPSDVLRREADEASTTGGAAEVQTRYELAKALVEEGQFAGAAGQYEWLWKNIPKQDPSKLSLRNSALPREVRRLLLKYPRSTKRFTLLRDEAEKSSRADWVTLNRILGDDEMTLRWFDAAKKHPSMSVELQEAGPAVREVLFSKKRYADAAMFYPEPLRQLSEIQAESEDQKITRYQTAIEMYSSLLAAGREEEAERVMGESLKMDRTGQLRPFLFKAADHARIPLLAKAQVTLKGREREATIVLAVIFAVTAFVLISRYVSRRKTGE